MVPCYDYEYTIYCYVWTIPIKMEPQVLLEYIIPLDAFCITISE